MKQSLKKLCCLSVFILSFLIALPASAVQLPQNNSPSLSELPLTWRIGTQNNTFMQIDFTPASSVSVEQFPRYGFQVYYTFPGLNDYVLLTRTSVPSADVWTSGSPSNFNVQLKKFVTGTQYELRVVATSTDGRQTLVSRPISVRTPGQTPVNPSTGTALPANPSQYATFPATVGTPIVQDRMITLPISSNRLPVNQYPGSGYRVYQCELEGTRCVELNANTTPTATFAYSPNDANFRAYVSNLTLGVDYDFVIGARRSDGANRVFTRRIETGTAGPDHLFPNQTTTPTPTAVCGNNVLENGEVCDSAAVTACSVNGYAGTQRCNSTCQGLTACATTLSCGDGSVNGTETCDGNSRSCTTSSGYAGNEACNASCTGFGACTATQSCGDGTRNGNEVCDGNTQACTTAAGYAGTQACSANCGGFGACASTQSCGDGVRNGNETCDEGSQNGTAGHCNATCSGQTAPVCGNGVREGSETCDEGAQNGTPNHCNATCSGTTDAVCGNQVREAGETCDSSAVQSCTTANNYSGTQQCRSDCQGLTSCTTTQRCGDGTRNGNEVCDDGAQNGMPNRCNSTCSGTTASACGNGTIEAGESCEAGQSQACVSGGYPGTQSCNSTCNGFGTCATTQRCGDGATNGNEACDGNSRACTTASGYSGNQSCLATCAGFGSCTTTQSCGDGARNGTEVCDGGSQACTTSAGYAGTQACNSNCGGYASCTSTQRCGDGARNGNEACDDGNLTNGDGCSSTCALEQSNGEIPPSKAAYWASRPVPTVESLDIPDSARFGVDSPIRTFPQNNTFNRTSRMAVNLNSPRYWVSQWMYLDLFKSSGEWNSRTQYNGNSSTPIDLDANGWVRSIQSGQMVTSYVSLDNGYHGRGRYVIRYEGSGTLEVRDGVTLVSSAPGRMVVNYANPSPTNFFTIAITQTNPSNYIRNIQIYKEELEALGLSGELFHPAFLEGMKHYKALRFMQAQGINNFLNNQVQTLTPQNRSHVTDARWANWYTGMPFEVGVMLANRLNANPWMNIHYGATDEYVRDVAQASYNLMRGTTSPIYVEYGNEPWNSGPPYRTAVDWMVTRANARWGSGGTNPYPGYNNVHWLHAALNWYGMRSTEICAIWKQVYGAEADRVKCTVNVQTGYVDLYNSTLNCPMYVNEGRPACASQVDVLSPAPYFGAFGDQAAGRTMVQNFQRQGIEGINGYLNYLEGQLNSTHPDYGIRNQMTRDAATARRWGLELSAYEGGAHDVLYGLRPQNMGDRPPFSAAPEVEFLQRASRHPRMYSLFQQYMAMWRDSGGQLFCHFNGVEKPQWEGQFGLKEFDAQVESPKFDAVRDFAYENPCNWDGCTN